MAQITEQSLLGLWGPRHSFSAKSADARTRIRTMVIPPRALELDAGDVLTIKVTKYSGSVTLTTIQYGSALTIQRK